MNSKCEDVFELLPMYLSGYTGDTENAIIFSHVAVCVDCRGELARLVKIKNAVKLNIKCMPEMMSQTLLTDLRVQIAREENNELNSTNIAAAMVKKLIDMLLGSPYDYAKKAMSTALYPAQLCILKICNL